MANEFVHSSIGTTMTQAEFESVGLHVCNSQATGDLIYASSATQLSRLGITNARLLISSGGVPTWSATLPAITLGGTVTGGSQTVNSLGLVGIGQVASSVAGLAITATFTDPGADTYTLNVTPNVTASSVAYAQIHYGINSRNTIPAANTQNWTAPTIGLASFLCRVANLNSTSNVYTITGAGGIWIRDVVNKGSAIITTAYSICLDKLTGGTTNYGIYSVDNNCYFGSGYLGLKEMSAPGAGGTNEARIYAVVDGGTLTDLAAVFQDGTVDIFAQEVTPLDAPTFIYPSGTETKIKQVKPHPGIIKFVAEYADGQQFTLKEIHYHNADKIAANIGCDAPLPEDWEVETTEEMTERLSRLDIEKKKIKIAAEN